MNVRAERRAALGHEAARRGPWRAPAGPEMGLTLRSSPPALVGMAPRPAFLSGDRPTYPSTEGLS